MKKRSQNVFNILNKLFKKFSIKYLLYLGYILLEAIFEVKKIIIVLGRICLLLK